MTKAQITAAMKSEPAREISSSVQYTTKIGRKNYSVRHVAAVVFGGEHCSPSIRAELESLGFKVVSKTA